MGCCGSKEIQTQSAYSSVNTGYKNVTVYNKSNNKKLLICVQNNKTSINASTFDSFGSLIAQKSDGNTNTTSGSNKSFGIPGFVDFEGAEGSHTTNTNNTETKKIISSFLEEGYNHILPNKRKKFGVENKVVYISAIDSDGTKLLYNFNTLGENFVYDGQSIDEMDNMNDMKSKEETHVQIQQTLGSQIPQQHNQYTMGQYANITYMGLYKDKPSRAMNNTLGRTNNISKSLKEFRDKLIKAKQNIGYFATQDNTQIFYSLGDNKSYSKYMRITGDIPLRGKINQNIRTDGFNGAIDVIGGSWNNAVYKIELGYDKNDSYESWMNMKKSGDEYDDLSDNDLEKLSKLNGKITFMGIWTDNQSNFCSMKNSFGGCNNIASTLEYKLKKKK
eukprot:115648_1